MNTTKNFWLLSYIIFLAFTYFLYVLPSRQLHLERTKQNIFSATRVLKHVSSGDGYLEQVLRDDLV